MSIFCCKELKGWYKSFTRTEIYLTGLQGIFFIVLVASLTFIILHFLACDKNEQNKEIRNQNFDIKKEDNVSDISTTKKNIITNAYTPLPKDIECTWTPSEKTTAVTHYYDPDLTTVLSAPQQPSQIDELLSSVPTEEIFTGKVEESYDGKEADKMTKGFLLALVKIKPSQDIIFGCTLTIVASSWTITAASCIEAIEEVDSLDSFMMMRNFGEKVAGSVHAVSDVLIHPQYQGVNRSYDLAALKSEDNIAEQKSQIVTLPTMVDYLSVTIGEKLSILGYGKYRNLDEDPRARKVREVSVVRLPAQQCGAQGGDAWALRHLARGRGRRGGACGAGVLCAGVGAGPGAGPAACRYCAGAPLLQPRRRALLGLMSDNPHCGLACDPALYVNLAALRDWLDSLLDSD